MGRQGWDDAPTRVSSRRAAVAIRRRATGCNRCLHRCYPAGGRRRNRKPKARK